MGRGALKAFYLRSTIKVEKYDMLSTYGTTAGPPKKLG